MIKEGVMIEDRYEIMTRIGKGGMADVYKGRDTKLNRYVAIKVLKREFREDEIFVKKFQSEAQAAAALMHPNIVNVYDVGEFRGLYFMVMELVEGITLKEYIVKKGRLTPKEVISITLQVCAGIETAHNNGIIHRDIKPQNIMISKEGKVKVTDFGIAKAATSNTISTNAMGSVHYTSPEQARGGFSDMKSDIYSLGITMFEMVTGELPFDGESTVSIAIKHLQEEIASPSELVPDVPYSLERIILKCTQKSPDRRYANMGQLMKDLKHSLVDPEGDFVNIAPFASVADTVPITEDDLERIQRGLSIDNDTSYEEEDEYEKDEYTREYDNYDEDESYDAYDKESEEEKPATEKSAEVNPKMAKIMKVLTIVVVAIIGFILVFTIGRATGLLKFGPKPAETKKEKPVDKKVEVPDFLGKTEEEAKKIAKQNGLQLRVIARKESEKYEEGFVSEQKTAKGVQIPKNAIIQVVVSSGLKGKEIIVPNVNRASLEDAKNALIQAGFQEGIISVQEVEHNSVERGLVIGTTPEADASVTADTPIVILVSKGSGKVSVPSLIGKSASDAMAALGAKGLNGSPSEEYNDKTAVGVVFSQTTGEGTLVAKGTTIGFVVSKGPQPKKQVAVPSGLSGQLISSVKATLQNLGLHVSAEYAESTQYADGFVISVQQEGQSVEEGATVVVKVSTGPGPSLPDEPDQEPDEPIENTEPVQ